MYRSDEKHLKSDFFVAHLMLFFLLDIFVCVYASVFSEFGKKTRFEVKRTKLNQNYLSIEESL